MEERDAERERENHILRYTDPPPPTFKSSGEYQSKHVYEATAQGSGKYIQ